MQSKSTLIISWLVAALLLIVGSVGWAKFFGERDTSKKLRKRLEQTDVACEPTEPRAPRTDLRAPEVRTIIKKIPSLEACLTNPIVKRNIKKSAKKLANILSDEKVEEYKEEQKIRRSKRFHKRMERREATFVKAINAFNEKANLDEKTARKLHGVFEDTFDKTESSAPNTKRTSSHAKSTASSAGKTAARPDAPSSSFWAKRAPWTSGTPTEISAEKRESSPARTDPKNQAHPCF